MATVFDELPQGFGARADDLRTFDRSARIPAANSPAPEGFGARAGELRTFDRFAGAQIPAANAPLPEGFAARAGELRSFDRFAGARIPPTNPPLPESFGARAGELRSFDRLAGARIPPSVAATATPAVESAVPRAAGFGARVGGAAANAAGSVWSFLTQPRTVFDTARMLGRGAFASGRALLGSPAAMIPAVAGAVASKAAGGDFSTGLDPAMFARALGEGYARFAPTWMGGLTPSEIAGADKYGASDIENRIPGEVAEAQRRAVDAQRVNTAPAAPAEQVPAAGGFGATPSAPAAPVSAAPEVPAQPAAPTGLEGTELPALSMVDPSTAAAVEQEAFNRGFGVAYGSPTLPSPAQGGPHVQYNRQIIAPLTIPALPNSAPATPATPAAPAGTTSAAAGGGASLVDTLFPHLIQRESSGNQAAVSSKGATGVAQVMPSTGPEAAKLAGLPWDPQRFKTDATYNAALGKAYFTQQMTDFGGDPAKALAAYNAGPGALNEALTKASKAGTSDWLQFLPPETRAYVPNVLGRAGTAQQAPAAAASAPAGFGATPSAPASRGIEVIRGLSRTMFDPATRTESALTPAGTPAAVKVLADLSASGINLHPEVQKQLVANAAPKAGDANAARNATQVQLGLLHLAKNPGDYRGASAIMSGHPANENAQRFTVPTGGVPLDPARQPTLVMSPDGELSLQMPKRFATEANITASMKERKLTRAQAIAAYKAQGFDVSKLK